MTRTEGLLLAIVVLLLVACSLLGYGVYFVRESVQIQRRVARMWLTLHRPTNAHTQEERTERV